eukprot:15102408-Alexandrium_andersonii.AAC.1
MQTTCSRALSRLPTPPSYLPREPKSLDRPAVPRPRHRHSAELVALEPLDRGHPLRLRLLH